jgi:hypothetical protein
VTVEVFHVSANHWLTGTRSFFYTCYIDALVCQANRADGLLSFSSVSSSPFFLHSNVGGRSTLSVLFDGRLNRTVPVPKPESIRGGSPEQEVPVDYFNLWKQPAAVMDNEPQSGNALERLFLGA